VSLKAVSFVIGGIKGSCVPEANALVGGGSGRTKLSVLGRCGMVVSDEYV
jgi:hypothetical protein